MIASVALTPTEPKNIWKTASCTPHPAMLTPTSLVLVCLLPAPRDLEIARVLGWYRIPFRSAPKVIAVDYLAFYQPGRFFRPERHPGDAGPPGQPGRFFRPQRHPGDAVPPGGCIQLAAPVRGHELTTRVELLRDEPQHPRAAEEYFKIQLGPLEKLPAPVRAGKWKRVTFLYTTGEYLLNARTLNDLVVKTDERALLWRSLRERAENDQLYHIDLPPADLPPEVLLALLGIKEEPASYHIQLD